MSKGEPPCAKRATSLRTRSVAIDTDVDNLQMHFRLLGERFTEGSNFCEFDPAPAGRRG